MSRFHPTRQAVNAVDASHSSASSLDPALSSLSPEDAEILEAIVAKSPDATTFMTVFKAYSEVLQQRGLDPGNDVVYYKQLLKLGVVKGSDWGTKWNIVKNQLGLDMNTVTALRPARRILPSQLSGLASHEEDVFTLHSHADETETAVDNQHVAHPFVQPSQPATSSMTDAMESSGLQSEVSLYLPQSLTPRERGQPTTLHNRTLLFSSQGPEVLDEAPIRSSTPPLPRYRRDRSRSLTPQPKDFQGGGSKQPVNRIDEAETWKRVERERQTKDADRFRQESLLAMCFETWKVGLDWIRDTHTQIAHARNHIQLRIFFQQWRRTHARIKGVRARATQVAHFRAQTTSFRFWRAKAHQKRIAVWREEVRNLMFEFKQRHDDRVRDDAWTKWRQLYQARQLYAWNAIARMLRRWRERLQKLAALELLAVDFEEKHDRITLGKVMQVWSSRIQLHDAERYIVHKADGRTLSSAFTTWHRVARDQHCAYAYQASQLLRRSFDIWRKAQANLHALNNRSDKYLRRRDNLLLRAVLRVWVARERGQLLQRVRSTRLLKDAFIVWEQRRQEQEKLQAAALAFEKRSFMVLLASSYNTWVQQCEARKNAFSLSEQRYIATLLCRTLSMWRLKLRTRLRIARRAKVARKYFLEKQAWDKWRFAIMENRRKRTLQQLEDRRLKLAFSRWLEMTRRKRLEERTANYIQRLVYKRVLRDALQHWTNRVVNLKLREIDTVEQCERDCIVSTFTKWKDLCHQHVENLSLVNSFQDVKREETLRRTFLNWLAEARKAKMRRIRLAEREQELRLDMMSDTWETWRGRFCENMLRDIEYRVIIQNQTNLLYRAFVIWQSHSKSLPGIRFYATSLKTKFWDRWRDAMPLAIQARKARGMDAKTVLAAVFEKWAENHRKKLALKAVARARYLRLPSPGRRASNSAPPEPPPLQPLLYRPLRSRTPVRIEGDEPIPSTSRVSTPAPFLRRRGLSSLLAARPVSRADTTENSAPCLAPSLGAAEDDDRRERLWKELRGVHLHSRAKSR